MTTDSKLGSTEGNDDECDEVQKQARGDEILSVPSLDTSSDDQVCGLVGRDFYSRNLTKVDQGPASLTVWDGK